MKTVKIFRVLSIISLVGLFFLFNGSILPSSQEKAKGRLSDQENSECPPAIYNAIGHYLYPYIENEIIIDLSSFPLDSVRISFRASEDGRITKKENGNYSVLINHISDYKIGIEANRVLPDGDEQLLSTTFFHTLPLPRPIASLDGNTLEVIKLEKLKSTKKIDLHVEGLHKGLEYTLLGYDYIYKPSRAALTKGTQRGASIPKDLQEAFANASRGDLLLITAMTAQYKDAPPVAINGSLVYTVVN